jgi:hypothetical protein
MTTPLPKFGVALTLIALALGCRHVPVDEASKMAPLGPALTKLTAVADASVEYGNPPPDVDEAALLDYVTRRNPKVLAPFAGFAVRVVAEDKHAIVLVCDDRRTRALLEDVGCTMNVDRQAWKDAPAPPCAFTLHVRSTCELPESTSRGGSR